MVPGEGTADGQIDVASLTTALCLGLGEALGTQVPTNAPLMSIGLDSIAAVEFTNAISEKIGIVLSSIMLFDHPTLDSIASHMAVELQLDPIKDVSAVPASDGDASTNIVLVPARCHVSLCIAAA